MCTDLWKEILIFTGFILTCMVAIIFFVNFSLEYGCDNYAQATGRTVKYVNFDQCYVEVNGQWYDKDNIRPTGD